METQKQIKTKPSGINTHEVFVDGVLVAELRFHRPHPKEIAKGCRASGYLLGLTSGKRSNNVSGYSYFKDVVRDLPFLLEDVL